MIDIQDTIAEFQVTMRLDGPNGTNNALMVEVRAGNEWFPQLADTFPNQRILGEHLSDYIGARLAEELLSRHNIPRDWPVWKLNQKGGKSNGLQHGCCAF